MLKRADGTVDYDKLRAEIRKTKTKYSAPHSDTKRASGTVSLTDYETAGIDVLYYGKVEMGTSPQSISAYLHQHTALNTSGAYHSFYFF
jgi:hypothetical protein